MTANLIVCAAAALAVASAAAAQPPPAKRTILQHADVAAGPAQETLLGTVEIAPGSGNPRHTHNGTEMGVVVEGQIRIEIEGQPPRILNPGDSFLAPRGVPHQSILVSPGGAKLVSTWTVDKGAAFMTPAP